MPLLALATCYDQPDIPSDSEVLCSALQAQNIEVRPVVWNSPEISWDSYRGVLVLGAYDWQAQITAFEAWLTMLKEIGIPVFNPPDILLWNSTQLYLRDLAQHGISVVPSLFVSDAAHSLRDLMAQQRWDKVILQPTKGSYHYYPKVVALEQVDEYETVYAHLAQTHGVSVQPYLPWAHDSNANAYSLIYLAEKYSHAFHYVHQGQAMVYPETYEASENMIADGYRVLEAVQAITSGTLSHLRVDIVQHDGAFVVRQCDCICADLCLSEAPMDAIQRFATTLSKAL